MLFQYLELNINNFLIKINILKTRAVQMFRTNEQNVWLFHGLKSQITRIIIYNKTKQTLWFYQGRRQNFGSR